MTVPLDIQRWLPYISANPASVFHSSALLAVALDAVTMPFRLQGIVCYFHDDALMPCLRSCAPVSRPGLHIVQQL